MLVLLPPSETKRPGGGGVFEAASLREDAILGPARSRVRAALEALSGDPKAAAGPLKLGKKNRGELAHNLVLGSSGVMPAIERYTGVLYDALAVADMSEHERAWVDAHILVQSALFGLIAASDPIPAYRLSASARLPALGAPLKRVWAEAHRGLEWSGLVLDLRSKDYAELAPLPEGVGLFLHVVHRGADGEVRALNHFNKAAKGDLVRRLARSSSDVESVDQLIDWGRGEGLEVARGRSAGQLTLVTDMVAAGRSA